MCRQVGANARPVAQLAREFGVEWWTVMNAVIEHGTPLVEDSNRVGTVTTLGLDETSFLKANRRRHRVRGPGPPTHDRSGGRQRRQQHQGLACRSGPWVAASS